MQRSAVLVLVVFLGSANAFGFALARSGAGLAAATAARDQFRADIGGGTVAGANGSFGGLRREINWDGVPDALAAPNNLPANFFNVNSPRGVIFSTPGSGFQVSATVASGVPVRFGNIDPSYSAEFITFSPERLFTPLGSTVTDVDFFLPGTNIPATVSSFGVMFSDVDFNEFNQVRIELIGVGGTPMGTLVAPTADHDVSFIGITFTSGERLAHVRITSGNLPLAPGNHDAAPVQPGPFGNGEVAVMDDFIYSEPQTSAVVPAMSMSTLALLAGVLLCIGVAVIRT